MYILDAELGLDDQDIRLLTDAIAARRGETGFTRLAAMRFDTK